MHRELICHYGEREDSISGTSFTFQFDCASEALDFYEKAEDNQNNIYECFPVMAFDIKRCVCISFGIKPRYDSKINFRFWFTNPYRYSLIASLFAHLYNQKIINIKCDRVSLGDIQIYKHMHKIK